MAPPSDASGDTIFGKIVRGEIPCDKVYEGGRPLICSLFSVLCVQWPLRFTAPVVVFVPCRKQMRNALHSAT